MKAEFKKIDECHSLIKDVTHIYWDQIYLDADKALKKMIKELYPYLDVDNIDSVKEVVERDGLTIQTKVIDSSDISKNNFGCKFEITINKKKVIIDYKRVGDIGNTYGGLYIAEYKGKYYWNIENYDSDLNDIEEYDEITKELYTELLKEVKS